MKIHISMLLLTMLVYLLFGELNASGDDEGSSAQPWLKEVAQNGPPPPSLPDRQANKVLTYGPFVVHVWLDRTGKIAESSDCPLCYIPKGPYRMHNNYLARIIFLENIKMVLFVKDAEEPLGIRAPNHRPFRGTREPDESTWYVYYAQEVFIVKIDPVSINIEEISLMPENLHTKDNYHNNLISEDVNIGGLHFFVYRDRTSRKIVGAVIDRNHHPIRQHTELSASGSEGACTSKNAKRKSEEAEVLRGKSYETIKYRDRSGHVTDINLWLDSKRKILLEADFLKNYIPGAGYFKSNELFVHLIYVGEWSAVGYFKPNWRLLGVRAPNRNADYRVMEPTPTKWFIIYWSAKLVVKEDPRGNVIGISLFPKNLHQNPENRNHVTRDPPVERGGVTFFAYRGPDARILGAELDRQKHPIL